jgi:hypothetical protein
MAKVGTPPIKVPSKDSKLVFGLGRIAFSLIPLSPEVAGRRKTLQKEVVKGSVWTLDQIQGVINVNVPVRSTVVKLKSGGLWVHNPVAPTLESIEMMRKLEEEHGKVRFVVLATVGIEHKGTAGAFARYFPDCEIYIQPGQYAFPVDLPSSFYFPFGKQIREIPASASDCPWAEDFEQEILGPIKPPGPGAFSETAFFHKPSKTLIVTDCVIEVSACCPSTVTRPSTQTHSNTLKHKTGEERTTGDRR